MAHKKDGVALDEYGMTQYGDGVAHLKDCVAH